MIGIPLILPFFNIYMECLVFLYYKQSYTSTQVITCCSRPCMSSSSLSLVMVTQRDKITITCRSPDARVQPEKSTDVHSRLAKHLLYTFTTGLWERVKNEWYRFPSRPVFPYYCFGVSENYLQRAQLVLLATSIHTCISHLIIIIVVCVHAQ